MHPSSIFVFIAAFMSFSLSADELVKFCKDERGNPYFTDSTCLNNKAALQRFWVSSAPSYHQEVSPGADRMVREWKRKQYRHLISERSAPSAPTWADRQAARNADVSIRAQRDMYRHRKSGPRDAAEMAIQYNMESVAGGGRHQVRVPDVTNVNVYGRRGRGSTVIVPHSSGYSSHSAPI